jgi:hypothetical protein
MRFVVLVAVIATLVAGTLLFASNEPAGGSITSAAAALPMK